METEIIDPRPTEDDKMFAMLIYLVSLFTAFLGPLLIWLLKRDDSDFIDYHGKEYFNFFISYAVYSFVAGLLMIVLIGFIILPIVALLYFIFTIIAAVKAKGGERYRIPMIFRIL